MFKRATSNDVLAHVFFTSEGYDDFRVTETPKVLPFTFATAMDKHEYTSKLREWSDFRSLMSDDEMLAYIESISEM